MAMLVGLDPRQMEKMALVGEVSVRATLQQQTQEIMR